MRRVLVVGVGAGDPAHITVAGIDALRRTDVVLVVDKGDAGADLAAVRDAILAAHLDRMPRRIVIPDVERDRGASDYEAAVDAWRSGRLRAYADAIGALGEDETAAFLVWGDPAVYDGTVALLHEVRTRGIAFEVDVVPGISAASALAAAHRVPLNRVGESILFTTGRRLGRTGLPASADNVVVFLDAGEAYRTVTDDVDIWWGAYLGTPDQLLVSGRLAEVRDQIARVRADARARKGWMFDTYLLRRR